ncbi:hypothetical protein [Streptomyces sp. NPDC058739]
MAVLAVLIPVLLLGVLLALGWYEDLLLPQDPAAAPPATRTPARSPASTP